MERPGPRNKTPLSLVYLHGFSASRKRHRAGGRDLGGARSAPTPFSTRLAAHGRTTPAEFATVTAQDWLDDAREALAVGRRIGDRVVLIGISTGALLATMAALEDNSLRHRGAGAAVAQFRLRDWRAKFISGPLGPGARTARHRQGIFLPARQHRSRRILDHALSVASHRRADGSASTTRDRSISASSRCPSCHLYRQGHGRRRRRPSEIGSTKSRRRQS